LHVEPPASAPLSRTFSEEERLATLRGLGILETAAEERFDRVTRRRIRRHPRADVCPDCEVRLNGASA
jgi:hypothetical protein